MSDWRLDPDDFAHDDEAAAMAAQGDHESRGHDGCDCAELCSMGPTCPGGMLAGLDGSGCWRRA